MKQRKEEMVEKCLEAYFHLTVKGEERCLFQDKNGNLHKPYHKEDGMYVFLQESPKTDIITYVKELHRFCTKIVKYVMKTKEVKIEIPEGYEIDKEKSTFEKIVFKKKDAKPRSWKEYYKNNCKNKVFEGIQFTYGAVDDKYGGISCKMNSVWQIPMNLKLTKSFLAMMQLMSLRQAWIGDWEPDWRKSTDCVAATNSNISATALVNFTHPLSFPTKEMAQEFLDCFRDLLEAAKPLI